MRNKRALAFAIALLFGTVPLLSACYTMRGAGEDLQSGGRWVSHSANEHTDYRP